MLFVGSAFAAALDTAPFAKKIDYTISGYAGGSTVADLPVLVRLSDDSPRGFSPLFCLKESIRFADANGNLLAHEIDTWNPTGESTIWVKVPSVSGTTTSFTMYYGGRGAETTARAATEVWSNYAAVFHGGVKAFSNAVGNSVTGSAGDVKVVAQNTACKVGGGIYKPSCNIKALNYTNPVTAGALTSVKNMTLSGWFRPNGFKSDSSTVGTGILASSRGAWDDANNKNGFALMCEGGTWLSLSIGAAHNPSNTTTMPGTQTAFVWEKDTWSHYAFTYRTEDETETFATYCNGALCSSGTPGNQLDESEKNASWAFGGLANAAKVDNFRGDMDELRVMNGAASADYLAAEYATVAEANFVTAAAGVEWVNQPTVDGFTKRIDFTLSDSAKTALAEKGVQVVPVAIRLSTAIKGFAYQDVNADLGNLVFGALDADGKTLTAVYPYEVETWKPTGTSILWVLAPVSAEGTVISLVYGGNKVVANQPTDVWNGYLGVWHMNENGGNAIDATGHGFTGVPTKGASGTDAMIAAMTATEGVVGSGRVNQTTAGGKSVGLVMPNYDSLITDQSKFTVSGWFLSTNKSGYPRPFSHKKSYNDTTGWEVQMEQNSDVKGSVRGSSDKGLNFDTPSVLNQWNHFAFAFDGGKLGNYVNGNLASSGDTTVVKARTDGWTIGNNINISEQGWCGSYDEVRLYDGTESAERLAAEVAAMREGFLTAGAVQAVTETQPMLGAITSDYAGGGLARISVEVTSGTGEVFVLVNGSMDEKVSLGTIDPAAGYPQTISGTVPHDADGYLVYSIYAVNDLGESTLDNPPAPFVKPLAISDFRKKFTVTMPETLTETLTDFPLLVRLDPQAITDFSYDEIYQNGKDVVALSANGEVLPSEMVWNPDGVSLVWVKVPELKAGTEVTIAYGTRLPTDSLPAASATWSDYAGVWHMDETEGTAVADSAAVKDGVAATKTTVVDGVLGKGRSYGTTSAKNGACVLVDRTDKLDELGSTFTVSGWLKCNAPQNWGYLFGRKSGDTYASWGVQCSGGSNGDGSALRLWSNGTSDQNQFASLSIPGVFPQSEWKKYMFVYTESTITLYVDGALIGTKEVKPGAAVNGSLGFAIGGLTTSANHGTLPADHDEVKLRKGAVNATWAAVEYAQEAAAYGTYSAARPMDASAPVFGTVEATVAEDGATTVSIEVLDGSGTIAAVYNGDREHAVLLGTLSAPPTTFTDHPAIPADAIWSVMALGTSPSGSTIDKAMASGVMNARVGVVKTADANEDGLVPGIFTLTRPAAATELPLIVNLDWSGTAVAGVDFADELPVQVTIPAGETELQLEVKPLLNGGSQASPTVALTVLAGPYISGETAELTIRNLATNPDFNTWVAAADSDGLASTAANWSLGVPTEGQAILFDGRFSLKDCTWDIATDRVASWTQNHGYTGIVTIPTVYDGKGPFTCLTVTGAMTLESGVLTHPLSRQTWDNISDYLADLKANETYRLRLTVGSLTVGSAARIDATNKGYYQANSGSVTTPKASHGGWFGDSGLKPYDDVKEPIHIGLPAKPASGTYTVGIGGGAIYIVSTGDAVVDGTIRADTGSDCWNQGLTLRGAAAAGSVYLKANKVTGSGTISASAGWTDEQNSKGCGGRVAVIATSSTPVDFTTLKLKATVEPFKSNGTSECDTHGSAGTVFVKDASQTYGTLLVDNVANMPLQALSRPVTVPCNDEGDWTFDRLGLGHNAVLVLPEGTALVMPNGINGVFSLNAANETNLGSIRYEGGTLDVGTKADQVMDGAWMFTARSPYTFSGNLTVRNGATIGIPSYGHTTDNNATALPAYVTCDVTVTGDLTLAADGVMRATGCGFRKNVNGDEVGLLGYLSHGGRTRHYGTTATLKMHYEGYDSVFAPFLPGCSVPEPNGQGCGLSGGVLKLTVTGRLTVDGTITANGSPDAYSQGGNASGGPGGAIDITAGTISGADTGKIMADGGSCAWQHGVGGRIAVKLTGKGADFAAYAGRFSASGRARGTASNSNGSSGTIYLQTGAEGDKAGTIRIASRTETGYYAVNDFNTTEIASLGYGGDEVVDYKKVKVEVGDYATAAVNTTLQVAQVTLVKTTARLDLEGHKLKVNRLTGVDGEGAMVKVKPGTYTAADLAKLGLAVIDSSADENGANATGTVEVMGTGFVLIFN